MWYGGRVECAGKAKVEMIEARQEEGGGLCTKKSYKTRDRREKIAKSPKKTWRRCMDS